MSSKFPTATETKVLHNLLGLEETGGCLTMMGEALTDSTGRKSRMSVVTVNKLASRNWVQVDSDGQVSVTERGKEVAQDASAVARFKQDAPDYISISLRDRGRSPIKGLGSVPKGRNVSCWSCYKAAVEAGTPLPNGRVVWFTNESGADAGKAAQVAAARHYEQHLKDDHSSQ